MQRYRESSFISNIIYLLFFLKYIYVFLYNIKRYMNIIRRIMPYEETVYKVPDYGNGICTVVLIVFVFIIQYIMVNRSERKGASEKLTMVEQKLDSNESEIEKLTQSV